MCARQANAHSQHANKEITHWNESPNENFNFSCWLSMYECLILLGIDDNIKTDNVFDFILLLAKQYLYKCKMQKISQTLMFLEGNYYPDIKKRI